MSRSRNARRGSRAAVQRRPTFGEDFATRLGGPTPHACRAVQAANDEFSEASQIEPEWCGCARCCYRLDDGDGYDDYDGRDAAIWTEWQEGRAA